MLLWLNVSKSLQQVPTCGGKQQINAHSFGRRPHMGVMFGCPHTFAHVSLSLAFSLFFSPSLSPSPITSQPLSFPLLPCHSTGFHVARGTCRPLGVVQCARAHIRTEAHT